MAKMVYRCDKCGKFFRTPRECMENVGFAERPHWEYEYTSPCCRVDFDEYDESELTEGELADLNEYEEDMAEQRELEAMYEAYLMGFK